MSGRPQGGSGSFATLIAQAKEQEQSATEENERLKRLVALQESLVTKQREALLAVTNTCTELAEVEQKRTALKAQLSAQKSKLLIAASHFGEVSSAISQAVEGSNPPSISAGKPGTIALETVEKIQAAVFALTESSLKSGKLAVSAGDANALVLAVNEILEEAISRGGAEEDPQDTISRQAHLIAALLPATDGE
jgi:hypothetical protein